MDPWPSSLRYLLLYSLVALAGLAGGGEVWVVRALVAQKHMLLPGAENIFDGNASNLAENSNWGMETDPQVLEAQRSPN